MRARSTCVFVAEGISRMNVSTRFSGLAWQAAAAPHSPQQLLKSHPAISYRKLPALTPTLDHDDLSLGFRQRHSG
jgi:hypothetical protein